MSDDTTEEELSENQFDFNIPIEKTYEDDEGNYHVIAVASSTRDDKEDERISKDGLEHLATQIRERDDIEFKNYHEAAFGFGKAVDAKVYESNDDGEDFYKLQVDFELKNNWPHSQELFESVKEGDCEKQLSIGGEIAEEDPGSVQYVYERGKPKKVINRINLDHIVACPSGHAANQDTHFVDAIVKTIDENQDSQIKHFEFEKDSFLSYKNGVFFQSENPRLLNLVEDINTDFKNNQSTVLYPVVINDNFYVANFNLDSVSDKVDNIGVYPLDDKNVSDETVDSIKDTINDEINGLISTVNKNENNTDKTMSDDQESDDNMNESLKNSVDFKSMPKADEDMRWNFSEQDDGNKLLVYGSSADDMEEFSELSEEEKHEGWKTYRDAHAYYNPDVADNDDFSDAPHNKNAYGLPHHKVIDGEMKTVLSGVIAQATKINGANGGFGKAQSEDELKQAFDHLSQHYEEFNREAPEFDPPSMNNTTEFERFEFDNHQSIFAEYLGDIYPEANQNELMDWFHDLEMMPEPDAFSNFVANNSNRTPGEVLDWINNNKSLSDMSNGELEVDNHEQSIVFYLSEITNTSATNISDFFDQFELQADIERFVDIISESTGKDPEEIMEFFGINDMERKQFQNNTKVNDFVPNNPENYMETQSEDWDGHDYEDFRPALAESFDSYDSVDEVSELFTELPVEQKDWIASRFGIVMGDEINEETEYGALKEEHHAVNGDVDRAGVIAARQRLPTTDADEDAKERLDQHLVSHLENDFNEENVEPVLERKDGELILNNDADIDPDSSSDNNDEELDDTSESEMNDQVDADEDENDQDDEQNNENSFSDLDIAQDQLPDSELDQETKLGLEAFTEFGNWIMNKVTKEEETELNSDESCEEVELEKDDDVSADESEDIEVSDDIKQKAEKLADLKEDIKQSELSDEEVNYVQRQLGNNDQSNQSESSTEGDEEQMNEEKFDELLGKVNDLAEDISDINSRVDSLQDSENTDESPESDQDEDDESELEDSEDVETNESGDDESDDSDELENTEEADADSDDNELEDTESDDIDSDDSSSDSSDDGEELNDTEESETDQSDSDDDQSVSDEKLDALMDKVEDVAGSVNNLNDRVTNLENRTAPRQGQSPSEVNKTSDDSDDNVFSGTILGNSN